MKKNVVKRLVAAAMALCMVVGFAGCGDSNGTSKRGSASSDYDKTIDFTCTTWYSMYMADAGYDLESEPYTQWVMDKFNVEIDAWALGSSNAMATTRLWINGGTMPDMFILPSFSVAETRQYMEMGMLKALPEDWKEQWPNIASVVEATGYAETVEMNGLTYAIPHATFYKFTDVDPVVNHSSIHYRKDWANQVGMSDLGANGTIKLSELKEYIEKVADAGLCSKPYLAGTISGVIEVFKLAMGIDSTSDFTKSEDGTYIYTPETDEYIDLIKTVQQWYKGSLLDPDAYVTDTSTAFEEYKTGLSPAIYTVGGVGNYQDMLSEVLKRNGISPNNTEEREKLYDVYGMAAVAAEDGTVYAEQSDNYYTMTAFNPNIDDETLYRILDMIDYFCTAEGQVGVTQGIPGEDWEFNEEGGITILNEDMINGEYEPSPSKFFNVWGTAGDDVAYVPGVVGRYAKEQQLVLDLYDVKLSGEIFHRDMHIVTLDTEAKDNYNVAVASEVTKLVVSSKNIESDWKSFIAKNKNNWQAVIDDLNK